MSAQPPLSPSRAYGDLVFVSGQIGIGADGIPADFTTQARLAMEALAGELEAAGASFATVLKATVFITRAEDFAAMNQVYAEYLGEPWPARTTLVCDLALPELLFEIDAVAHRADTSA